MVMFALGLHLCDSRCALLKQILALGLGQVSYPKAETGEPDQ